MQYVPLCARLAMYAGVTAAFLQRLARCTILGARHAMTPSARRVVIRFCSLRGGHHGVYGTQNYLWKSSNASLQRPFRLDLNPSMLSRKQSPSTRWFRPLT